MISRVRATKILTEPDPNKRSEIIDKLTEQDAKYLLKICIQVMRGKDPINEKN